MGGGTDSLSLGRDTAGQERYQTITKQYYRRAQVRGLPVLLHRRGETEAQFWGFNGRPPPPAGHFPGV